MAGPSVRAIVPLLIAVCLGTGCSNRRVERPMDDGGPPVRGGTLEVVGASDVDHLATTSAYVIQSIWLERSFTRQLVTYPSSADFETSTSLAADLSVDVPSRENGGISADGLTYTFRIRDGVRWDSRPPREVTAADIVRGFRLMCNPVSPVGAPGYYTDTIVGMASYCERFARVTATVAAIREFVTAEELDGVRAIDEHTVAFRLLQPASDFLNLLAMPFASPVPIEYLDYLPDSPEFRQHTLSAGPYRIARYVQNREIVLERNPVWIAAADPLRPSYVDRIRIRIGSDLQLQQLQIEAGTEDMSFGGGVPSAELASLLATNDPTAWLPPAGGFAFLTLNHVGSNNGAVLQRVAMRRAIALAIDRAAVVQVAGGPRVSRPLLQAVPRSTAGFLDGADRYATPDNRGDVVEARRLLADAGAVGPVRLRLVYAPEPVWMRLGAQAIQASLARAGIDVELFQATVGDLYGRLLPNPENAERGEWDLALIAWTPDWFGENNGRSVIPPLFDGRHLGANSTNYGRYHNRDVDVAIDRANAAVTVSEARQAWRDVARRLMDDVAMVPLVENTTAYARSRRVRNCNCTVLGVNCNPTGVWLADRAGAGGSQ